MYVVPQTTNVHMYHYQPCEFKAINIWPDSTFLVMGWDFFKILKCFYTDDCTDACILHWDPAGGYSRAEEQQQQKPDHH